ncbi:MBL fold metallo-hydrolase [Mannheimia sp. AT1]|uniref:MBL fold metallo-hydrolase n=1 Tax=Mannheimia cairinae TaxID=3025936 RepID=A0ABT5ML53_9PAST|nr:MBL fold metallo-hydrolase [Mannheimia cairinae]MDD0822901.1 MBL fold metallo-hydrolase [Mannheimia cairinae]MDD0826071.1 MBL fold metallo-hydrolase [Mannheimia cairinae]
MKLNTLFSALALGSIVATSAQAEIQYQHIRNATAKITYGDATFLVDPYLAEKGAYEGFAGTPNSQLRNPLIALAEPVESVLKGVDAVIVTHTHDDHWDEAAQKLINKELPIFVQDANDAKIIRAQGFKDVRVVGKNTEFKNVKLSKTGGQHGTDEMYSNPMVAEMLGEAMGVVFQTENEKTLYILGDTIWNEEVESALNRYQPEVVVMNTGGAEMDNFDPAGIIMDTKDVAKMAETMPKANIITVHMDTVNHGMVSKADMREFIKGKAFEKRVAVPNESEVLKY